MRAWKFLSFGAVSLCLVWLGATASALAQTDSCAARCPNPWVLTAKDGKVASGASLLIRCLDCEKDPGALEVVADTNTVYAGALRFVDESHEPTWINVGVPLRYFVWTPERALPPGGYQLRWAEAGDCKVPERTWTVPASAAEAGAISAKVELSTAAAATGSVFACTGECDAATTSTRSVARAFVWITPDLDLADPRFATHLARMIGQDPSGELEGGWLDFDNLRTAERMFLTDSALSFPTRQAEYCVTLELMEARTGQTERLPMTCVTDDLGELAATPKFARPFECMLRDGRSKYEAAFCADNRADCSRDQASEACENWQTLCGSAEPPPAPDAGPSKPEDEDDETSENPSADSQKESGGCTLHAGSRVSPSPLMAASALASLLLLRQRRRARRQPRAGVA